MNIRPKTVRRLSVLFAVFAICAAGVAALLVRSVQKEKATVASIRAMAFADFNRHDYPAAVKLFGTYLNAGAAESTDAEAVFAYGMARSQVPMEGNRHIAEAINLLQKYLDLAPTDAHDARHQLLMLYSRARYNKEARTLASELLGQNPRDVEALRAETAAMINDRDFAGALTACQTLNQLDPTSVYWQDRQLQLMSQRHEPAERIVAHARELAAAHPGDPRFQIVLAGAFELTGDSAQAEQAVEAAARLPPPDAITALRLIAMLGRGSHTDLADDLLARADAKFKDSALDEFSCRRMLEKEQYAGLAARLSGLDAKSTTASANLLAYDAIAQFQTGHRPEGDAIVSTLLLRKDAISAAWAAALRAHFARPPIDPAAAIKAYGEAIAQDRTNPLFPCFLGEARAEMGEVDEAVRDWNTSAQLSPFWAEPVYRISRILSSTGRPFEALGAAQALLQRAPNSLQAQVAYALAAWGRIQATPPQLNGPEGAKLLEYFERIRSNVVQEPDTLAAYAALLSRRGNRDKAIEVVRSAIRSQPPLPEGVFEHLLPVSFEEHWGIDSEILDAAEKAHGLTPHLAYDRAIALFRNGKQADAVQLADTYCTNHSKDADWRLDDAHFRDAVGQADSIKRWKSLCDAFPNDLRVQYAALSAPCRFSDRQFWQQTIDRVKALTGADGQAWQIEQARLTLTENPSAEQVGHAIDTLQKLSSASPELGEVHHLLGRALLLDNKPEDVTRAAAELTTAHHQEPDNFQITSELAALLISRGRRDEATELVEAVAREENLDEARRLWAAQMDRELGDFDAGIKLLTAAQAGESSPTRNMLLADLYLGAGRLNDAGAMYRKMSDDSGVTPAELLAAGGFFARAHQPDAAEHCVARLRDLKLAPVSATLLESELQELEGRPDAATRILADACRANAQEPQLWAAWAGVTLRSGKLDNAEKIAAAGLNAVPADPNLASMRARIAQLGTIDGGDAALLLGAVSREPREPALERTLAVLADAQSHRQSAHDAASALRPLADLYPRFFALQEILARRYVAAHDLAAAAQIASRAADLLPGDPNPLKMLTGVQTTQRNWDAARATALRWRQYCLANPLEADLEIARIDLQKPSADPASALKELGPYVQDSAPQSQRLAALPLYCRALLALGRIDDAAQRLRPLAANSSRWVGFWMEIVDAARNADEASKWLNQLNPLIASDATAQRIGLADAWERVGTRFDSSAAHEAAREILRPIVAGAKVPPEAWRAWALANQLGDDLPQAQRAWQKLVEAEPRDPSARNNLAYVLLLEGADGKELSRAQSLAKEAIAADPNAATFYDTLARIEARLGKPSESIRNFRVALEKDPDDVEAMIGLADELQSQPSGRDEARSLLSRINAKIDAGIPLMRPIRIQLERVKTSLTASVSPGE